MELYTIKDKIAGVYLKPFYANNSNEAKRTAGDIIADTATINRHVEDYELYKIAEVEFKFIDYLDNINKSEPQKRYGF